MIQLILPSEVRTVAGGLGIFGRVGVIYQTTNELPSRAFLWDGEKHVRMDEFSAAEAAATKALVSRAQITADDTGTEWLSAPSLLSFSAVLASGASTTVLLEVRDAAGTVATAGTIVADTVAQTLRNALLLRQQSEYRFRRSSGTGSVTITV